MIDWQCSPDVSIAFDVNLLIRVLEEVLVDHDSQADVCIVITDDAHVHRLNREYRSIDRPTDVLSFELDDELHPEQNLLGEVYVSIDTATCQASEAGRGLEEEVAHLAIHGVLHLLGHEHDTDAGFDEMRSAEDHYLNRCQTLNPRKV